MKILLINSVCGYGSTGKIVVDLYNEIKGKKHDCCVAFGRGSAPDGINVIKFGNKIDFYTHVILTRIFDCHGFASKRVTKRLIKKIRKYEPDIIHLHNIHGYYINIEILFKYIKEEKIPIVWTLHDCWTFTGHCAHFEPVRCDKWKKECYKCELKKDYPKSSLLDASKRNYFMKKDTFLGVEKMLFVSPSKWLANMLKQSYLGEYDVKIIQNGIDTKVFKPLKESEVEIRKKNLAEKYKIDFSKKVFLGVASVWTKEKGFEDFLKIANMGLENIQFVLVGVSKKQKDILPLQIVGIERTEDRQEMAELYACADVFLNPTYADTFPTVNMEAISCGTPVVTYNTCGSPENVPEDCGVIVEKGNYNDLVKKALELKKNPNTLILASEEFDKEKFSTKYFEVYTKMVKK